jgi:hypothetical protein
MSTAPVHRPAWTSHGGAQADAAAHGRNRVPGPYLAQALYPQHEERRGKPLVNSPTTRAHRSSLTTSGSGTESFGDQELCNQATKQSEVTPRSFLEAPR